ncbi:hypothetical protein EYF80_033388 [Liparis tanakae]|uniref:Uncharacterized protein n=1 Tax=Liparis tanakae TaxID=230148 RepID=A0A4Z2GS73_9TELE|nr:hypothetical protein EYF80_033388 [Liparis tanakae]
MKRKTGKAENVFPAEPEEWNDTNENEKKNEKAVAAEERRTGAALPNPSRQPVVSTEFRTRRSVNCWEEEKNKNKNKNKKNKNKNKKNKKNKNKK